MDGSRRTTHSFDFPASLMKKHVEGVTDAAKRFLGWKKRDLDGKPWYTKVLPARLFISCSVLDPYRRFPGTDG